MTPAQRAALDVYFAAMASAGAKVLANATQARRILAADAAASVPAASTFPVTLPATLG